MPSSTRYLRKQENEDDLYAYENNESVNENIPTKRYKVNDMYTQENNESVKENTPTKQSNAKYNYLDTNHHRGNLKAKASTKQQSSSYQRPLTSTRDPRRLPLLDRLPFAPNLHHGSGPTHKTKKGPKKKKCEITPAYAFKNASTGLLEIRSVRPPDSYIVGVEMSSRSNGIRAEESIVSKPALYPIALNGGGVGMYNDPREFGVGGISNFSKNKHQSAGVPSRGLTIFPWNLENGTHSDKKVSNDDFQHVSWVDNSDVEANLDETLRQERRADHNDDSMFSPWKTWEKVHNCMVRIAERTQLDRITNIDDNQHLPTQSSNHRLSMSYNEDDYDFALVLKPKAVYAFWADLLDFQEENGINTKEQNNDILNIDNHDTSHMERGSMEYPIDTKPFHHENKFATPDHGGMKRRRKNKKFPGEELSLPLEGDGYFKIIPKTEPVRKIKFSRAADSPPRSTGTKFNHRRSLFDRAVTPITPPRRTLRNKLSPLRSARKLVRSINGSVNSYKGSPKKAYSKSPLFPRAIHNNMPLPSIGVTSETSDSNSLSFQGKKYDRHAGAHQKTSPSRMVSASKGKIKKRRKKVRKRNRNTLEIEDIPTQVIPRGIAARTNGMEEFLSALKRGIVVRRHRPHNDAGVSIKISSSDGGDTMQYIAVKEEAALLSVNEQMVRYNRDTSKYSIPDFVSVGKKVDDESQQERETYDNFLPDHIAAEKYRDAKSRMSGGITKKIFNLAVKATQSGTFKAADIVAVHRANIPDPFSSNYDEYGSCTLRESNASYNSKCTFSVVLLGGGIGWTNGQSTLKIASEAWYDGVAGDGSNKSYRYLDIEAATQGEFWMIFRGFLLLQRDAASGRFAAERASGFSSNYNKRELEFRAQQLKREGKKEIKLSDTTIQEPEESSWVQTIFSGKGSKRCEQIKSVMPSAPPSDYFLGFKSPGTQIWGRLRQAGLQTQRIYALDTRRVMIKVRCPTERLMDVAEALRIKLKTTDGFHTPFEESLVNQFVSSNDSDRRNGMESSLFRSSDRQQIIDFIIKSRIRDLGAELGQDKKLGKDILLRTPIHMHARLESLYNSWVLYYREANWASGRNAIDTHGRQGNSDELDESRVRPIPPTLTRFIVGSFNQPLDSVEEYFGERVTFYFAWLQHCSQHLISLSLIGLIVFICQITSGRWDHPLRPYFSVIVMIWSFRVLIHWRKRQNFLSYRWGTMNFKIEETTRPQFRGEWKECKIAGEREHFIHYPSWKRWLKYCISIPLTAIFTVTLLLGVLVVYANRDIFLARYFSDRDGIFVLDRSIAVIGRKEAIGSVSLTEEHLKDPRFWYIIGGIPALVGLSLPLINSVLMQISQMLNEFENHRTETQYRNALIIKVIAFRFVCYFAALYYYAYIATGTDQVVVENGILRVATCLITYVTVANWWSIFLTIYSPLLLLRWRLYRDRLNLRMEVRKLERMELGFVRKKIDDESIENERKLVNKRLLLEQAQSKIWEEVMLPEYDPFADYVQAVMNFTYVVCFSAILPIVPLFVLANQLLSMRLNAYKICRARRRPLAQKTGGIGVWSHVLHIVSVMGILTNCSLVALTSSQFHPILKAYGNMGLFGVIVGWEHIMFLIKYLMQAYCSPYPMSVLEDMKREGQEKKKKRNSSLRAKKGRRLSHYSSKGGDEPQLSPFRNESYKNSSDGSHLNSATSILSTDQPETTPLLNLEISPDVALTRNIKSETNGPQLQQLQGKKVRGRKALATKLRKRTSSSFERTDNVELKTPQHTERVPPYENSIEGEEVGKTFIDSPFNIYNCANDNKSPSVESPKLKIEGDNSSISNFLDFDDNRLNNDNYNDSFENGEAGKRIIFRLSEIEKRNSKNL